MPSGQGEARYQSIVSEHALTELTPEVRQYPQEDFLPISPLVVLGELWEGRYLILGTAMFFLFLVTIGILTAFNPVYISTVLLEKKQQPSTQPTIDNSLLATLTRNQNDRLHELFVAELDSLSLAERIQNRYHIVQKLFPQGWNAAQQEWEEPKPSTLWGRVVMFAGPYLHVPPWHPPDAADLQSYITRTVVIEKSDTGQLFHIHYSNSDRQFSHDFLNIVITELDALLKEREENYIERRVTTLNKMLSDTSIESYRAVLRDETIRNEALRFIIQADSAYSVDVVAPVQTPISPSSPRLTFLWSIAFSAGFLVGVFLVFARNGIRQYRNSGLAALYRGYGRHGNHEA